METSYSYKINSPKNSARRNFIAYFHLDRIPRETRSSAFAIVLGVRSRSSRVRSWIWVAAPRRSTERDLANFATYVSCRVDWFQARRAGTSSAGVEGPGCRCKIKSERPGGPPRPVVITTGRGCVSPPGLMNANLYGSICIALVAMCGHYSQGALRAVGPLNPPPLTPPAKAPVEKGGPSGWMERT